MIYPFDLTLISRFTWRYLLSFEYVTLSLGISRMIPAIENSITEFIEAADQALHQAQAKEQGRNQFVIPETLIEHKSV